MSLYLGNCKLMNFTTAIEDSSKIGSVIDGKATTNLYFDIMADEAFQFEANDFTMHENLAIKNAEHGTVKAKTLDIINANGKTMYIKVAVCRINDGTVDSTDYIYRAYAVYATYNENNIPDAYNIYKVYNNLFPSNSYNDVEADFWYEAEDNFILSINLTSYDINL